jgi:hypothetical protein
MDPAASAALLGYPAAWLTFNLLPRPLLADQLSRFHAGDCPDLARLRFAAFERLLRLRHLDDALFDQYVHLATLDPDAATATAALCGLLEHPSVTPEQLARLAPVVARDPILEQRYRCLRAARPRPPATPPPLTRR